MNMKSHTYNYIEHVMENNLERKKVIKHTLTMNLFCNGADNFCHKNLKKT